MARRARKHESCHGLAGVGTRSYPDQPLLQNCRPSPVEASAAAAAAATATAAAAATATATAAAATATAATMVESHIAGA